MPLFAEVDWFLTNTMSPVTAETPSIVCSPERVIFAVVANFAVTSNAKFKS